MNIPLTPIRFLRYAEQQYPQRTAVVCGGERFTYAQVAERVARLAGALRKVGVQPGERVAFLSTNCHRLLEAYYGVVEASAVLLPLNIRLAHQELAYVLNDSGARVLFYQKRFFQVVEALRTHVANMTALYTLDGAQEEDSENAPHYEALLADAPAYRTDIMTVDENAVAELFYTSGTGAALPEAALDVVDDHLLEIGRDGRAAQCRDLLAVHEHRLRIPVVHLAGQEVSAL